MKIETKYYPDFSDKDFEVHQLSILGMIKYFAVIPKDLGEDVFDENCKFGVRERYLVSVQYPDSVEQEIQKKKKELK